MLLLWFRINVPMALMPNLFFFRLICQYFFVKAAEAVVKTNTRPENMARCQRALYSVKVETYIF